MTVPVWVLLGFAGWTLSTLSLSVGVYRWSRILTGPSAGAGCPPGSGQAESPPGAQAAPGGIDTRSVATGSVGRGARAARRSATASGIARSTATTARDTSGEVSTTNLQGRPGQRSTAYRARSRLEPSKVRVSSRRSEPGGRTSNARTPSPTTPGPIMRWSSSTRPAASRSFQRM